MRKLGLRIFLAFIGVAGLGLSAKAQDVDHIRVKIPYEFVLAGKTLPAGTYTVSHVSGVDERTLIVSDLEDHATVIVLPTVIENHYSEKSGVNLEQMGGEFVLSQIRTPDHVFTLPVSSAPATHLAIASPSGASGSGISAGK
jgi:hypothetical protein